MAAATLPLRTQSQGTSQTANTAPTEDLWTKALNALSDTDRKNIHFDDQNKLGTLEQLLAVVNAKKQLCVEKHWKYKRSSGKEILIRDQLEKVVKWVNMFKEAGDTAVQYDPAHASLPWAGVCVLLQITVNDSQTFGAMIDGVETVTNLITRYAIVEQLYLRPDTISMAKGQLSLSITRLYTAVLEYLLKAKRYYDRKTIQRTAISLVQSAESKCGCISKQDISSGTGCPKMYHSGSTPTTNEQVAKYERKSIRGFDEPFFPAGRSYLPVSHSDNRPS
ncbi:MAG: hypothetical protein MMC33_003139 [Icmadophila ericetorum]|nr:hypothetical protein [Icmadophila ericetorum]